MLCIRCKKASLLLLFFLSGCLSMSDREKKEHLAYAPSLEKSEQQGIDSGVFSTGNWPDKDWWNSFNSPLLNEWIETAFSKNPSLKAVESWIEQARQVAQVARSTLMPNIYFDAQDTPTHFSEHQLTHLFNPALSLNGYQVDLLFAFNYEFDFWNKNRNLFRAAIGELRSRQAEWQEAELIISTSLAQAYFSLLTTIKKKELYEDLTFVRKSRFILQEDLQNKALLSAFPPLLSDEGVKEAEQYVLAMQNEINIEKHLINVLMGRGPDEELSLDKLPLIPPASIPLPKDLSIGLLSRRPDLMAQIWKAESLSYEVSAAKADFFPNINLAAFAGIKSVAWNTLFQTGSKTAGYTPAISLPIFTAGSIRANLRAKKASFDQAIFEYNNLLLVSAQEVADHLSQVQTVYKQKELQVKIVEDAKKRLDLTLLKQASGLDSQFDFLNFKEALIEKKISEIDLIYGQYSFLIKLIKSLGGGYTSSHLPIDKEKS